jgi:plastocyanin
MRACFSSLLGLAALLLFPGAAASATKTVQVGPGGSLTFSPASVTVTVGDTVEWQWMSGAHTTTRAQGPETWDSGIASAPFTFSHTFMQAGTFPYVCSIHEALGMTGTVRVRSAASSTTTVPTVTTTSSPGTPFVPSCDAIEVCRTELLADLPSPASAKNAKERRTARLLQRLGRRASHQLERAQSHLVVRSRRTLERLRTVADSANAHGTLGVPVGPIDAVVASLLVLDQPS